MSRSSNPTRLLHIDSSALGDRSVSRSLSAQVVQQWRERVEDLEVTYRDLALDPIAHLTGEIFAAGHAEPDGLAEALQRERALTEALIAELLAADVIVVGAPMYNFSISSQLKAWIDRIVQAGRTFRYVEGRSVGLATGKRAVIVSSRGGVYTRPDRAALDFQESYLRRILGFIGVDDVLVIRAEGLGMGGEAREQAIAAARTEIADIETGPGLPLAQTA